MKKFLLLGSLLPFLSFAVESFSQWWSDASTVCVVGQYRDASGEWRDMRPFCCRISGVSTQEVKGYAKTEFGIKEKLFVRASCTNELWGVIRYRGEMYLVSGNAGVTNTVPNGFLKVVDGDKLLFRICKGPADFGSCEGGYYAEGYLLKR
ncbi:MAG: hypothetical protein GXN96_02780 [Aquificae bacterium]|nr:hypothetical protein [Aquificota bacterium]